MVTRSRQPRSSTNAPTLPLGHPLQGDLVSATTASAGHVIVRSLALHGVPRVFCVPGESYLDVLDGLHDSAIQTVICRHEGGAAYMAEAEGKMSEVPGVAMVTRGPGAANAFVAIHTAWQDATAMVLFVGLVPLADRDRESFQEFDINAWFGTTAKRVLVLDEADRASEVVAEAFFAARSGRPGPVVVGLPEDVITHEVSGAVHPVLVAAAGGVSRADASVLTAALARAERPLLITGGNDWTQESATTLTRWLEGRDLPAATDWRANGVVSSDSPCYVGALGYGRADELAAMLDEADLVVTVGTVLGDVLTDGYTLRQDLDASNILVNIDTSLRGRSGAVTHQVVANPAAFVAGLDELDVPARPHWRAWRERGRLAQERYAALPDAASGDGGGDGDGGSPAAMDTVMAHLVPALPSDAVVTFGAGNHALWAQRYFPTRAYGSLLSTRNGSMGYSVPSAVAASLHHRDRVVVSIAGDGEFMMNANELATATQYGATPLIVVMDNGQFGTIRAHQEAHYPGRVSGTRLENPDFAAIALGCGAHGERVTRDRDVPAALERALGAIAAGRPAVLHLVVDPVVLQP
ncbi:MAG: thiamine pyrophosphate-dependent enzyme [Micrococcales bacterium]|nr:thiamine pyrophosphate-dependent enzyme [Micrococcales bacterium]